MAGKRFVGFGKTRAQSESFVRTVVSHRQVKVEQPAVKPEVGASRLGIARQHDVDVRAYIFLCKGLHCGLAYSSSVACQSQFRQQSCVFHELKKTVLSKHRRGAICANS